MQETYIERLQRMANAVGADHKSLLRDAIGHILQTKAEAERTDAATNPRLASSPRGAAERMLRSLECKRECWCTGSCRPELQELLRQFIRAHEGDEIDGDVVRHVEHVHVLGAPKP